MHPGVAILASTLCACGGVPADTRPPAPPPAATAPAAAGPHRDRELICPAPEGPIAASLYEVPAPARVAVVVDVGARPWDRWGDLPGAQAFSHYRVLAEALQDAGVPVLLYDKRGTGRTRGETTGLPGRVRDSLAARACLEAAVPGASIVRVGHSAGSVVACRAWRRGERLVLLSPVGSPEDLPHAPTLIVRGEADGGRPADDARLAARPGIRWIGVPGADHLLMAGGRVAPEELAAVVSFVTQGSPR